MKKPFLHAFLAASYIVFIVSAIFYGSSILPMPKDSIFMPMGMLTLFVLSAAIMGFLFLSEPIKLYLDGHKKEAVSFFLKTVGFFACFGLIFLILIFLK